MTKWLLAFFSLCLFLQANAQVVSSNASNSKGFSIGGNVLRPLGEFSSTHIAGIGIDASPSHHKNLLKQKKITFTYDGGIAYYIGRKERTTSYSYKYPAFIFIHAIGGLLYVPVKKIAVEIMSGPALGIYNGATRFNIGGKLEAGYTVSNKVSIGPGIIIMKEPGTNTLWAAAFRTTIEL